MTPLRSEEQTLLDMIYNGPFTIRSTAESCPLPAWIRSTIADGDAWYPKPPNHSGWIKADEALQELWNGAEESEPATSPRF